MPIIVQFMIDWNATESVVELSNYMQIQDNTRVTDVNYPLILPRRLWLYFSKYGMPKRILIFTPNFYCVIGTRVKVLPLSDVCNGCYDCSYDLVRMKVKSVCSYSFLSSHFYVLAKGGCLCDTWYLYDTVTLRKCSTSCAW